MPTSLVLVFVVGVIGLPASAQGLVATQDEARGVMLAQATPELAILMGRWVRPDGGYAIVIKSVDPSGKMDATYSNPNPINVSKAEVSVEGGRAQIIHRAARRRLSRVHLHAHLCPGRGSPHRGILPGGHAAEIRRGVSKSQVEE